MPTKQRVAARAAAREELDLRAAGDRSGYAAETLRKLMWTEDPPPLYKRRNRWYVRAGKLDEWVARRDGQVPA
jgi:hypothetical protein